MQKKAGWVPRGCAQLEKGSVIHHVRSRIEQQLLFLCFIAAQPPCIGTHATVLCAAAWQMTTAAG